MFFRAKIFFLLVCFLCIISISFCTEEEKFYIAVKAFDDSFYDASISLFERFIQSYPQSNKILEAKFYIAKSYYFKGDYSTALKILGEIVKKSNRNDLILEEVYYWLAETHFRGKSFIDSLNYAEKIIKEYPQSKFIWWVYLLIGNNYLELGEKKKAEENFKKILKEASETDVIESTYSALLDFYFQEDDFSQLIYFGEKYIRYFPKGELEKKVYFYLGEAYYAEGDNQKAINNYKIALKDNNDTYFCDLIYRGLAFSYLADNNLSEAKKYITSINNEELKIFSEGIYYFKIKDYGISADKFSEFLVKFPKSKFVPTVYLNRANSFYEMGRINDSISDYTHILNNFNEKKYSDILDKAHYGLAWAYLKSGQYKKAIEEFKNTLRYTENPIVKISSKIQIADAYQEAKEYQKALDIYNEILFTNPGIIYADYIQFQIGLIFLKTKRLDEALLALRNLQKNFPSSKLIPEAQYYLAVSYFSMEKYQEAEDLLKNFMEKFSDNNLLPKVYYLYGKCFFNKKDYLKAIEVFKNTLEKFKDDKELVELLYIDIGNAYLNLFEFDKARKLFEDFLKKYPSASYAGYITLQIGEIFEKQENYLEAETYYRKVIDFYKDSIWVKNALFSLAHLYWRQGNLSTAEEYFKKLIEINEPISVKAKLSLAKIYAQKGENKEAMKLYDELIGGPLSEVSKIAISEKAFLLKEMNEYPLAIKLFEDSISNGIDSPKIRLSLGFCLEKINRLNDAIEQYFKVVYLFDDVDYKIKAYFNIAKIYEKQKQFSAAKEIYNKIISFNTEEAEIARTRLKMLKTEDTK